MKENFKNILAFIYLRDLGYPLKNVRISMHKLTEIGQPDMAKMLKVSRQQITLHDAGVRNNPDIQKGMAGIYGIPMEIMFDGREAMRSRSNGTQKNNTH